MTMDIALQPDEIERRRKERARHLALYDIPLMRVIGSSFLALGVYLNNRFLAQPGASLRAWWTVAIALSIYAFVSWLAARVVLKKTNVDLTLFFLFGDIVLWSYAIYATGAEKSWLFFIPVLRVADQMQTTVRRCLAFTIWAVVSFGAMLLYVHFVDARPIRAAAAVSELAFIGIAGIYVAMSARTSESRRAQMAAAIRISRDLIVQLEEQSVQLRDARQHAEEASAAKSEFLANMSHEMRTPLHGVIGMLQLAADGEVASQRLRQIDMARRSAEALLGTIDDILDFSKIEARKVDLEPVYFSLRELMQETMKPLGVTAAGKGLSLAYVVQSDVPDAVWADPLRLRQIVINLVGNSIKFTSSGEIAVRVSSERVEDDAKKSLIRFEVRDTGIGIDRSQHESIFQPFTQADASRTRRYGGTGLGLAIVARLVEEMGGSIALESALGIGSAFTFTISAECDAFAAPQRREWESELAGKSMLVVDPYERSRAYIAEMLRSRGIFATACATFAEAPRGRFACAIAAGRDDDYDRVVIITSPLETILDDHVRVTRPVGERELIDACGLVLGLTTSADAPVALPRAIVSPNPLHILVVEDHPVNQEFAAEALRRLGHDVVIASDGHEALTLLETEHFDVVFMDVQLPGVDGLDVTRRIRATEHGARTPIFAMTAHTRREERDHCIEAGMDGVLTKPIDRREIAQIVRFIAPDPIVTAVGGNLRLLARVSAAFSEQTPPLVAAMRDAIANRDSDALYRSAHKLKGSVSNFPTQAVDVAREIEELARGAGIDGAAALMPQLEDALRELEQRLAIHA